MKINEELKEKLLDIWYPIKNIGILVIVGLIYAFCMYFATH